MHFALELLGQIYDGKRAGSFVLLSVGELCAGTKKNYFLLSPPLRRPQGYVFLGNVLGSRRA